ncbi:acidPPc domain-containing protein [Mycena chlorophos]|uniref:AcidPPc domain-containing protein n=1 Tax=Mycena chlorophos TaxID=658473 RepID=A0A8H6S5H1_MYCCL|nr:acidPPc domain-containing protein [Mycena chlorophos]
MANGFPWDVFSANTLRSMVSDIYRAHGGQRKQLNKDESLDLLRKIEKNGLDKAIKNTGESPSKGRKTRAVVEEEEVAELASPSRATRSKRKHEDAEEEQPKPKRGRPTRQAAEAVEESISAPARRGRSTRRKPAQDDDDEELDAEEEEETTPPSPSRRSRRAPANVSAARSTRSSRSRPRVTTALTSSARPRRNLPKEPETRTSARVRAAAASASTRSSPRKKSASVSPRKQQHHRAQRAVGRPRALAKPPGRRPRALSKPKPKPKAKAKMVFDGVELRKFLPAGAKLVNGHVDEDEEMPFASDADIDAPGEVVTEDAQSMHNSNKENEASLLEIATAQTDEGEDTANGMDLDVVSPPADPEPEPPVDEEPKVGSPPPQLPEKPTDDEIEEARLHDSTIGTEQDAPEITIEPTAEDAAAAASGSGSAEANGGDGTLLRPTLILAREGSVELNPEYNIEVFSPTSAVGDESWIPNPKRTVGGVYGYGQDAVAEGGSSEVPSLANNGFDETAFDLNNAQQPGFELDDSDPLARLLA